MKDQERDRKAHRKLYDYTYVCVIVYLERLIARYVRLESDTEREREIKRNKKDRKCTESRRF